MRPISSAPERRNGSIGPIGFGLIGYVAPRTTTAGVGARVIHIELDIMVSTMPQTEGIMRLVRDAPSGLPVLDNAESVFVEPP